MTSPANELMTAIQTRLTADAALVALIGPGGLSDRRVNRLDLPVVVAGSVETRDFSTATEPGAEIIFTLEAWSGEGRRAAEAIAEALRNLLDGADLALSGRHLVNLRHRRTVSHREPKTTFFVAEASFRAVVE
jgi:hypothetical protein